MKRRLFCEISPLAYELSVKKECLRRYVKDKLAGTVFAGVKGGDLPILIYKHSSLIRRTLGNVDARLQENKAVNLALAAPLVDRVLIGPGEVFSFCHLVGNCTRKKGYKAGLTITGGKVSQGIGGGMCQFTNLLHWMVLHSPLDVIELHHHNGYDLFPDYGRQVPFGLGTSIFHNYVDYRVKNNTDNTFQFLVTTTETHLAGELRVRNPLPYKYHITEEDKRFVKAGDRYYRRNRVFRTKVNKITGVTLERDLICESNAEVLYDSSHIPGELVREL